MRELFAAVHEPGYGPTRTFPWTSAYVGCLRASGLVMLAARFSESDPERPFKSLVAAPQSAGTLHLGRHFLIMSRGATMPKAGHQP
jgi:hypothetical protein